MTQKRRYRQERPSLENCRAVFRMVPLWTHRGSLWNCRFCGGYIAGVAPTGDMDRMVEMPVRNVTTCSSGAAIARLFTSQRHPQTVHWTIGSPGDCSRCKATFRANRKTGSSPSDELHSNQDREFGFARDLVPCRLLREPSFDAFHY